MKKLPFYSIINAWGCIDRRESTLKTASRIDWFRKNNQKLNVDNNDKIEALKRERDSILASLGLIQPNFATLNVA